MTGDCSGEEQIYIIDSPGEPGISQTAASVNSFLQYNVSAGLFTAPAIVFK